MGQVSGAVRMKPERTSRRREVSNGSPANGLTPAARYQRRYRERQRRQQSVLRVQVSDQTFITALIESGWLTPEEALSRLVLRLRRLLCFRNGRGCGGSGNRGRIPLILTPIWPRSVF